MHRPYAPLKAKQHEPRRHRSGSSAKGATFWAGALANLSFSACGNQKNLPPRRYHAILPGPSSAPAANLAMTLGARCKMADCVMPPRVSTHDLPKNSRSPNHNAHAEFSLLVASLTRRMAVTAAATKLLLHRRAPPAGRPARALIQLAHSPRSELRHYLGRAYLSLAPRTLRKV
jgi:hypothetical protein